jgi:hypothetical protein
MQADSKNIVKRGVCPFCRIDAMTGPYAHAKREGCIEAMMIKHGQYRRRIARFVMDNLEEITNETGGVIGYRLHLNAIDTEKLCHEIESD